MPVTAEVVLRALRHVWASLEQLHLPMAVMGGLALSVWKHVRATQDVDLLVGLGPLDDRAVLETLQQQGFRTKRQPPVLALGALRIVQLLYEPPGSFLELQVDLLLADSEFPRQALARRIPARLPDLDLELFVLSCEDLILFKLLAGRILDKLDVAALLRANRAALDLAYLEGWVRQLSLASDWSEIWSEVFKE